MNSRLDITIKSIVRTAINQERKAILQPLIDFIQLKVNQGADVNLNFICTHNSRRSHLCQIWSQLAALYYQIPKTYCYSGGTEATALFPKVIAILKEEGMQIEMIADTVNPIYAIKFDQNTIPLVAFSKKYDNNFNPQSQFAAIMTCSQADDDCPYIPDAEKRIPVTFEDPKIADNTDQQDEIYKARSLEIASQMFYVCSQIKK
ncbi:Protein ArsC [compost metagenome]|uniref:protein-tyrosine-phosphatase n=1 Tax=Sphingobacterium faecium TaxID=34087 RepID=UPI000FB74C87|nr:protein-tyrosine-phosphatase [Sphingobacterium faecium]MQP28060.1 protein-tyrosine-phosphatase [Sphingobacterium faecium]